MSKPYDLAIVGSGFAGSLLALIARRLGYSVVLVERGRHPRFVIGESSTPLADILWTELSRTYDLPRLAPLSKWGSWQRVYPRVGCGLKRGFTFYHHRFDQPFADDAERNQQLLVAASSTDEVADTHWYRPDFDAFLVDEAVRAGVEFLDETELERPEFAGDQVRLEGTRKGERHLLSARFLLDASGPRGFLHHSLNLPEAELEYFPKTQGLYTHFTDVRRLDAPGGPAHGGRPPYPPDDAALHHVFEGGWIWVLRFNNGIISAGAAVTDSLAEELALVEGEAAWDRLLNRLPTVREQFAEARPTRPFFHSPCLPFRCGRLRGERWALLPYAAGFVDPLLSTGFPLTLLGIQRLALALKAGLGSPSFEGHLADYESDLVAETNAAERLIAALYTSMRDAPSFSMLSLLYFAAAAYAEIATRMGRAELAGGFLLHDHPQFGPACRAVCELALSARDHPRFPADLRPRIREQVLQAIAPVDPTGLSNLARRNWYPVDPADLQASASKFGLTPDCMATFLATGNRVG